MNFIITILKYFSLVLLPKAWSGVGCGSVLIALTTLETDVNTGNLKASYFIRHENWKTQRGRVRNDNNDREDSAPGCSPLLDLIRVQLEWNYQ